MQREISDAKITDVIIKTVANTVNQMSLLL